MIRIYFATKVRGFFRHLFKHPNIQASFSVNSAKSYETASRFHMIKSRIARSWFCDWLGVIQRINVKGREEDICGSYNRFLLSDKPYFIYVENPTALYHYTLSRKKSILGGGKIEHYLKDSHLRALIFMSKACKETFNEVTGTTNSDCIHEVIYPLIPKNSHVSQEQIRLKTNNRVVKFLYIAQGERFLSKGAMEVINAFQMLIKEELPVRLTLVTNIHKIHPSLLSRIRKDNNIQLYDFKFGYQEMEQLYADHDVFLQPSSDDSFGLTVLEAMHAGKALITSKLYAFPEMVEHGVNGFLVEPHYWFFTPENIPNPKVWNHRRKTIYSGQISSRLTEELYTYMKRLVTDRDLLIEMSLASYAKANSAPFSEEYIVSQWNKLINQMVV